MLIDWFTVVAQIVNLLILVALMKRYLFGPLLQAIDERERRIATCVADAKRCAQESEERAKAVEAEKSKLEQQRVVVLAEARDAAAAVKLELLQEARAGVRALEQKWLDELNRERSTFFDQIRRRAAEEILAVTRIALRDLAGADLEASAIEVFLGKLASLDASTWRTLAASPLTVVTPGDLPGPVQCRLRTAIESRFGGAVQLCFEASASLAWGIELRGAGLRIGWTSDTYLEGLEERLRGALDHLIESSPVAVAG